MVKAGIITSIEETFFNKYKYTFLQKLGQEMMTIDTKQIDKVFEFGIIKIYTSFGNFKVTEVTIDTDNTEVKLNSSEPYIDFSVIKGGFHFDFDYHVYSEPELVNDQGTGQAYFKELNISIQANPKDRDGRFQIDFDTINFNCTDFGLNLNGRDLAFVVNNFADLIEEFVRTYLLGVLNDGTKNAI